MFALSAVHGERVIPLLAAALVLWLAWKKEWLWCVTATCGIYGGMLINLLMKSVFRRSRPVFEHPLVDIATYSFPSGHTVGTTLFYGVLAAYLMGRSASVGKRAAILGAATMMVALVGISRDYLGAHYPSDVAGAILEGLAWLSVCLTAASVYRRCPAT
jgi:undecaprenyl-diphosphatase